MLNITSGKISRAQKIVIYGSEGIGKTTFAAAFPCPLFIDTEGGTAHMDVNRLAMPTTWEGLVSLVEEVAANPGICGTLVIDTADWAEQLCIKDICSKYKKAGIEEFGYTDPQNYTNIATAIRAKNGTQDTYKPNEMAAAIQAIETEPVIEQLTVTEDGTYTPPAGVDGFSPVVVDCEPTIQALTVTENGRYTPPAGMDGYAPVIVSVSGGEYNANIHWYVAKVCAGDKYIVFHSDCELLTPFDETNFTISANVLSFVLQDTLNIKGTLDTENIAVGDTITFSAAITAYLHQNGIAEPLSIPVYLAAVRDLYEPLSTPQVKRDVLSLMTVVRNNSFADSGSDSCTFTNTYRGGSIGASASSTVAVYADSYLTVSSLTIKINNRDAGVYYVWKHEGVCEGGLTFIKVRWKGASQYNGSIDQEWEAVFLSNGDIVLRMISKGTYSGTYTISYFSYSITTSSPLYLYAKDYYHTAWDFIAEEYDPEHHHAYADTLFRTAAFADFASSLTEGTILVYNTAYDDNTYSFNLPSDFTWHGYSSVYASGNSWMGLGSASENVKMHRRDAKMWYLYVQYWILSDLNNLRAAQVSWRGAAAYSGSVDRWWTLWLFENGDAMIYISTVGSSTGTCTFYGQSYTGSSGTFISFYYDSNTNSYDIKCEQYTLEHHVG